MNRVIVCSEIPSTSMPPLLTKRANFLRCLAGQELFGYYECEKGAAFAAQVQADSPVVDRWNEYMKDVMVMEMDPCTGAQPRLEQVFFLP